MRILDLYCGPGGAAAGYYRAGFDVVGVDKEKQPNYPFAFSQADALECLESLLSGDVIAWRYGALRLTDFDAIHSSPPCQFYAGVTAWRGNRNDHPDLIGPTRELLLQAGLPYVIENVQDARHELLNPLRLCGSNFDLRVRRHRYFEANWPLDVTWRACNHQPGDLPFMHKGERAYADAMGCFWMGSNEARQAIPPAYTEHIGNQLSAYLMEAVTVEQSR